MQQLQSQMVAMQAKAEQDQSQLRAEMKKLEAKSQSKIDKLKDQLREQGAQTAAHLTLLAQQDRGFKAVGLVQHQAVLRTPSSTENAADSTQTGSQPDSDSDMKHSQTLAALPFPTSSLSNDGNGLNDDDDDNEAELARLETLSLTLQASTQATHWSPAPRPNVPQYICTMRQHWSCIMWRTGAHLSVWSF